MYMLYLFLFEAVMSCALCTVMLPWHWHAVLPLVTLLCLWRFGLAVFFCLPLSCSFAVAVLLFHLAGRGNGQGVTNHAEQASPAHDVQSSDTWPRCITVQQIKR